MPPFVSIRVYFFTSGKLNQLEKYFGRTIVLRFVVLSRPECGLHGNMRKQ